MIGIVFFVLWYSVVDVVFKPRRRYNEEEDEIATYLSTPALSEYAASESNSDDNEEEEDVESQ